MYSPGEYFLAWVMGSDTFLSHFSKRLSAYGPIFKFLSVFGHIFSSVCSRAVKMMFRVHSGSLDIRSHVHSRA